VQQKARLQAEWKCPAIAQDRSLLAEEACQANPLNKLHCKEVNSIDFFN
jgi:hypothetical protein